MAVVASSTPVSSQKAVLKKADFVLKPIQKVISDQPVIPSFFFTLADFMARYYFYPATLCLKVILPSAARIKSLARNQIFLSAEPISPAPLSHREEFSVDRNQMMQRINAALKEKKQVLILTPTVFHLDYYHHMMAHEISESIFPFTNDVKAKEFRDGWEKISAGEASVVLGLRSAIFLPWLNLGLVVVVEGNNESYKSWDQKPYYNSAFLAKYLCACYNCSLFYYGG